jgi:cysteine desulfuration protein SufE
MSIDLARTDAAQAEIAEEFSFFGDWTERYQYLIDLGRKLPALPETSRVETWKVSGCQSQVWIVPHGDAANLRFQAASDSTIVSGLIALVLRVYDARTAAEILATEPRFVEAIGLKAHLSPTRSNGLSAMLAKIQDYARQAQSGARFD